MKRIAGLAALLVACTSVGDDNDTGPEGPDSGATVSPDGGGTPGDPDAAPSPTGKQVGDCSNFASVEEHFDYLVATRISYDSHDRYKGIPWQGASHNSRTFPLEFTWSESLAATAQVEAERLVSGGLPVGVRVPGQDFSIRELWISGINTTSWRITAAEFPGDWEPESLTGNTAAALKNSNGSARLGFFYHDYGDLGPAITRMGVGGAAAEDCRVMWVLQMGP